MANKVPLSVDWLALSLRLENRPEGCPSGHKWAFYSSTNVWSSRWVLYNDFGEKVFTLLFQPRSSVIKANSALLEVANEWLYHGIGFHGVLGLLSQVVRFQVCGISRLDLAADFNPDKYQEKIIKGLAVNKYYVGGKRSGSGFWCMNSDKFYPVQWIGRIPHCQSWGHKTSDVKWKLYYKTKELRDAAGGKFFDKPYIVDMWHDVGLDDANVWRLEVSIHNCNNFDFLRKRLSFDEFCRSGSNLFQALYSSRFQVRKNQGHKDRTNDELVQLLDVGKLSYAFKVHRRDVLVQHNGRLEMLRHLVTDVKKEQVLLSDVSRESAMATIEALIEQDRFEKYFEAMEGRSFDDWREWMRVRAYYFGEEHLPPVMDDTIMEMALVEAGIIDTDPLGTQSSMSQSEQLKLF